MNPNINLLKSLTLLYAEDNTNTRELNAKTFEYFFGGVICAKDGVEAFESFVAHRPHVVILDILMPEINGMEVAHKIRDLDDEVPIMILSGHDEKDMLFKSIQIGVVDFIKKPLVYENFKHTLEICVKRLQKKSDLMMQIDRELFYSPKKRVFTLKDEEIVLTKKEQLMFEILYASLGTTIVSPFVKTNSKSFFIPTIYATSSNAFVAS